MSFLARVGRLFGSSPQTPGRMLGGFVDSLLQMFENCRPGLTDERLREGEKAVEGYFVELYRKERPRLVDIIRVQEQHLSEPDRLDLLERADERIVKVVIPAYARVTTRFTLRERNDFYLAGEALHGLERLGFGAAGIALGAFVIWAPFIPLWEKEWILPFAIAGLFFPNIRRLFALRRYQAELNALVTRTDNEIWRLDLAYLTDDMVEKAAGVSESSSDDEALAGRLDRARTDEGAELTRAERRRQRQGGR